MEGVLGFFLFGTAALLLGLTTLSVLSLSLVSDSGCLSIVIFALGWVLSLVTGMLAWATLAAPIHAAASPQGGVQISGSGSQLYQVMMWVFGLGYPIAAFLVRARLNAMPQEQSLTWKQVLTTGALFGFGVGTAGKTLKGGGGFGGFGGGSFGGGGAGGSFQGAAGSGAAASGAATGGASGAGQAAAAGAAGAGTGLAEEGASAAAEAPNPSEPPSPRSPSQGRTWIERVRPRHGCAFVLVALVFVGIGYGTLQALPDRAGPVLLVFGGGYLAYYLVRWYWRGPDQGTASSSSAFEGGEASSTWS
jgi:hypothetical protein